jgi:penicillin-binding protein 1A
MRDLGFIDTQSHAQAAPRAGHRLPARGEVSFYAPYAAEMARRQMLSRYGMSAYTAGYSVYTTIDSAPAAGGPAGGDRRLIRTYDSRHGYRGPERSSRRPRTRNRPLERWREVLAESRRSPACRRRSSPPWTTRACPILLPDERSGRVCLGERYPQARPYVSEDRRGPAPASRRRGPGRR